MFVVRAALEGLAAALLAASPDRGDILPELQKALDDLAAASGSVNEMVEIDMDFHRIMCALTGNSTLVHAWESLAGSIRMSIMFAGADSAITNMSVRRHQNIVDAIAGGDPGLARQVVERHMQEAMTNLSIGLAQNQAAATA